MAARLASRNRFDYDGEQVYILVLILFLLAVVLDANNDPIVGTGDCK
jgi:hypothetical protein